MAVHVTIPAASSCVLRSQHGMNHSAYPISLPSPFFLTSSFLSPLHGFTNELVIKNFSRTVYQYRGLKFIPNSYKRAVHCLERDVKCNESDSVTDEILLFMFQLDLTMSLQRALNMDQYDAAQLLRENISKVEQELQKQQESRRGECSKAEVQDVGLAMLRVKADLQRAIDEERYEEAAQLKTKLSKVEAEAMAASLRGLSSRDIEYSFRLGQRVKHAEFGYSAVVCGMDPICCEAQEWVDRADVLSLPRGTNQPFYKVLCNTRQTPDMMVAYVPEDSLLAIEQEEDSDDFQHPYMYLLFYGKDSNGDYIPIKPLREMYGAQRFEIPIDSEDQDT